MGRKKEEQEEYTLIEFLYKDLNYIESFYSQIFMGDIKKILKSSSSSQTALNSVKGSAGVVGGEIQSSDENKEDITEEIIPHDNKILKLFEEISPRFCNKICEAKLNGLNKFHGLLEITDYDITKDQFEFIFSTGLLETLFASGDVQMPQSAVNSGLSIAGLIKMMLQFQPSGCDIILTLSNKDKILLPLEKQYLCMKSEDIRRVYGSKLPGEWNIIGVLNSARRTSTENTLDASLYEAQEKVMEALNSKRPDYVLKPIIIYRKLK